MSPVHPFTHLRQDELERFLVGNLPAADLERLIKHLEECPECQRAMLAQVPVDPLFAALREALEPEPHSGEVECARMIESLAETPCPGISPAEGRKAVPSSPSTQIPVAETKDDVPSSHPETAGPPGEAPLDTITAAVCSMHASSANDPFFPDFPAMFGRYQVLERLGKGGMGAVYLAHDTTLDRKVALKVCNLRHAKDAQGAERFLREARSAAGLLHEGICRVLDYGVQDGIPFLTMDFINGRPLSGLLEKREPLEPAQAAILVRQVALALEAAHSHGVIHRDLKPSNIMLDGQGAPKVVDFGLARREQDQTLTAKGVAVGTPAYMSPEQVDGLPVDQRTDIYSLGVILYELLTGRRPFYSDTVSQLMYQIVHGELQSPTDHRPGLDPRLAAVCLQALSRSPQDRPATMAVLAAALEPFVTGAVRTPAPPLSTGASQGQSTCTYISNRKEPAVSPVAEEKLAAATTGLFWQRVGRTLGWKGVIAAGLVAAVGIGVLVFFALQKNDSPAVRTPFKGGIDVRILEEGNPERRNVGLKANWALPLQAKDKIRVVAWVNRPAYLYVIWINADGTVDPVYPWKPGHWDQRPDKEQPVQELSLPTDEDGWWEIKEGKPGMESLVMLVRETPLARDINLEKLVAGLPKQRQQNFFAAVWFENGKVVQDEAERGPNFFDVKRTNDPVLRTQLLLREQLGPLSDYSRAVSFANRGKPR
jgi:predicted Ser/Thr protein kinase